MGKLLELKDCVYGRLTVRWRLPNRRGGASCWLCRCTCGKEVPVRTANLTSGNTTSCGCLHKERAASLTRIRPFEAAYNSFVRQAPNRGLRVTFSYEEYVFHFTKIAVCYYCGDPVKWVPFGRQASNLDRTDSTADYTLQNCKVCCGACNQMKRNLSETAFLGHISKIAHRQENSCSLSSS